MSQLEEDVQYFINLIFDNIQVAKIKKGKKAREDAIFHNINIKSDGEEIAVWNKEKDFGYIIYKKEIEKSDFKNYLTKYLALVYIERLSKFEKNIITFEELAGIKKETNPIVKKIIDQKKNISEQLKLLRSNRNIPEVQEYIDVIYNHKYASPYLRYLIDKYYYNKKDLIRPEKNGLERMHKMILS